MKGELKMKLDDKDLKSVAWMKYSYIYQQIKVIGFIALLVGLLLIGSKFVFFTPIELLIKVGRLLVISGMIIVICLYVYLTIRISLTKKSIKFKYFQSMNLTSELHSNMEQLENGNSSSEYDMKLYNRLIVPKTFSIVTDSEVICFYYQAKPFRLNNLNKRNKQAIEDYISLSYSGHRSAWRPLAHKRYKNYYVNVIKL